MDQPKKIVNKNNGKLKRRSFLFGVAATTATAAGVSQASQQTVEEKIVKKQQPKSKLYNGESKHIKDYYRAAKF